MLPCDAAGLDPASGKPNNRHSRLGQAGISSEGEDKPASRSSRSRSGYQDAYFQRGKTAPIGCKEEAVSWPWSCSERRDRDRASSPPRWSVVACEAWSLYTCSGTARSV